MPCDDADRHKVGTNLDGSCRQNDLEYRCIPVNSAEYCSIQISTAEFCSILPTIVSQAQYYSSFLDQHLMYLALLQTGHTAARE